MNQFFKTDFICQEGKTLLINFSNLRNNKGYIRAGIYLDNNSFQDELPTRTISFKKEKAKNGKLKAEILINEGEYGIAVLDDENNNGKMDYKFFIPQEGYGFSNYIHSTFQKPNFVQFKFTVRKMMINEVNIPMKYIL
ncbi:MAG: hypothetical protein CL851_00200 [Crocinitomicaceae bacterium]|nr:hypothetical protein [Crocinitomicaceae bacterium]